MSLLFKKPVTSSLRHVCLIKKTGLSKSKILKTQSIFLKNNAGRNNQGRLTSYHKGGGHKKRYRLVLFDRHDLSGVVESIEYDPYRSANIARIFSESLNKHFYILSPQGLKRGHFINSQIKKSEINFKVGNLFNLGSLPLGVFVHNIFFPQKKTGFARSAGCSAQLISKDHQYCRVRLSSGQHRLFNLKTTATLGLISNPLKRQVVFGKAGRSRWLNKRPIVRGVAMNPIDHPHGGKTSGGRPSVTPWGKLTKGQPTRKNKFNKFFIK